MGTGRGVTRWRHARTYAAVAVLSACLAGCYHTLSGRSVAKPVGFAAADAAALRNESVLRNESREEGAQQAEADASAATTAVGAAAAEWQGSSSRAPWDPEGCQTIVFFHVPKTGGESVNGLWLNGAGRDRVPGWKDGYTLRSLRRTDLEPPKQEDVLRNM